MLHICDPRTQDVETVGRGVRQAHIDNESEASPDCITPSPKEGKGQSKRNVLQMVGLNVGQFLV